MRKFSDTVEYTITGKEFNQLARIKQYIEKDIIDNEKLFYNLGILFAMLSDVLESEE